MEAGRIVWPGLLPGPPEKSGGCDSWGVFKKSGRRGWREPTVEAQSDDWLAASRVFDDEIHQSPRDHDFLDHHSAV